MRVNVPVSQREYDYPSDRMLVSMTDTKGIITQCNHAFVETSGFSYGELLGQNHNLVRHPDTPPAAYRDLWNTIGHGLPWTALVKNRRKNGDHDGVQAHVTPVCLRNGKVRHYGVEGWIGALAGTSLTVRLGLALTAMVVLGMLPDFWGLEASATLWTQRAALSAGGIGLLAWCQLRFGAAIKAAEAFANDISGCNLSTTVSGSFAPPLGDMVRALRQIQINLRAVVGDMRVLAALVEESAASSDSLNNNSSSVALAVQVFQLP